MSFDHIITKADNEDLDAIKTCASSAYQLYIERIGREPAPMVADFQEAIDNGHLFVARATGETSGILAFVVFYARDDHLHLENVAVLPAAQGQGIGRHLIRFVEERARLEKCRAVELYTNAKMSENLTLYPKLGYSEIDRRQENGFDRVYFRKEFA